MNTKQLPLGVALVLALIQPAGAQQAMSHDHGSIPAASGAPVALAGQAAFAAIAEVIRVLKADPSTDWSKVNIEAFRRHLVDMDEVLVRSAIEQRAVDGGMVAEVTATGNTVGAIRRMANAHAKMMDGTSEYRVSVEEIATGARVTVTAKDPTNTALVYQIRGLGFAGLLTEGNHHAIHHVAMARGGNPHK